MDVLLTETEDENVSCPTRKINESVVLRKCHPKKLVSDNTVVLTAGSAQDNVRQTPSPTSPQSC